MGNAGTTIKGALRTAILSVPIPQSVARRGAEAMEFWNNQEGPRWGSDTHTRGAVPGWETIGPEHRELFTRFAVACGVDTSPRRILEWGAGGGANAVAFAPHAQEFIAVDVSGSILEECRQRVADVCSTPFVPVLVGVNSPHDVFNEVSGEVDLFLCLYVIELLPSKEHARRVIQHASRLLRSGGSAFVQVKYRTRSPWTRPRSWSYARQVAAMTSFDIDEFWHLSQECGLTPRLITLVPKNELDERYAYYFLTKD
ncbi:MAG TPA: class I SAM-dependent methyltransferase [Nocardioides sp.]|jgi:ubiquinone/menaquinone biosynthesis C-methylase UbiE|nr:class I SAM-dependent methyltransferase [Nocardioides sp.]